ncbi:hypothetical protein [Marilutibacter maris]|uniref:hypothetical protein n=1 Tax=Marilutibacter maris TaxID=1605891 RepID=UPI0011AE6D67|nr:hypothetical protein [Lysobacter maris]
MAANIRSRSAIGSSSRTSRGCAFAMRRAATRVADEDDGRVADAADRVAHFRAFRVVRCRKRGADPDRGESFFTRSGWPNFHQCRSGGIDVAIDARRSRIAFFALKHAVFRNALRAVQRLSRTRRARSAFVPACAPRHAVASIPEKLVSELLTPAKTVITFRPADGSCEHE